MPEKQITIRGEEITVSDGYHTFDELYEHRHVLFITLCKHLLGPHSVWRARAHADGTGYAQWFIMGINSERGWQITYHLPMRLWDRTAFAHTLDLAPEWDGHTPADVLTRLFRLADSIL